ncbi:MAG: hypothetical protein IJQ81_15355 [Oscillibacter sp.]|nr:hypothetical protein [Oscillibacter sp.]
MSAELKLLDPESVSFTSYQLTVKTKSIFCALRDNNRNFLKIAGLLGFIHDTNLYMNDFDAFETYAAQVFGIKKAQAYNLVTVGNQWVLHDEKGNPLSESVLPHTKDCDWGVTKLLAFARCGITPETAVSLVQNEVVSLEMSVKTLTAALKDWKESMKAIQAADEPEETEEETADADEPEETEKEPKDATIEQKREYCAKIAEAMDKCNDIYTTAHKAMMITPKTQGQWSAAHNMANASFTVMNDLFTVGEPRFFNYKGMAENLLAFAGMLYMQGVNESAVKTANLPEPERRQQLAGWTTALDSIRNGLNAMLTLYKEESGKSDNQ